MGNTVSNLESDLRDILKEMADAVQAEWADYERGLIDGANESGRFTGEWDHDEPVLDDLSKTLRLEAAEQMQRNTSTWSGGAGGSNNVIEGIRHSVASEKFSGGLNWNMHKAWRALDFNAATKEG